MNNTLTRLFTVALLMMVSLGARADVKVLLGEKGTELQPDKYGTITLAQKELTGGTIIISQVEQKDGTTEVTFAVTPDKNYKLAENGLEVYAVIPTDISPTRGLEVSTTLKLKSEDFKDEALKRTYTTTIDSKLALWVKSATFLQDKRDGAKGGEGNEGNEGNEGSEPTGPVEITKDTNNNGVIDDGEKKLYLIQTQQFESFYITPKDGTNLNTVNLPHTSMLWYFLEAEYDEVNDIRYYYIVNNKTGEYIYNTDLTKNDDNGRLIRLGTFEPNNNTKEFKFYLIQNGTTDYYYIYIKQNNRKWLALNKQGGNLLHTNGIRLTNSQYIDNINSRWKFIPYSGTLVWPDPPFTVSTDDEKHYYKICNRKEDTYYISTNPSTSKVTFSSTPSSDMTWYFKEASSDGLMKYYYVINPAAGNKYMYYDGNTNTSEKTSAVSIKDKNESNAVPDRFLFVIVQAAVLVNGTDTPIDGYYMIVPKLLIGNLWSSNSLGTKSPSDGIDMGVIAGRGDVYSHWSFETTEYSTTCGTPTITYSSTTGNVSITTTTTGATIHYTIDGTTEPSSSVGNLYGGPFDVTGPITIKAIATKTGFTDSEVITVTFEQVATPTIQNNGENAISITTTTDGATIYFTTDGTTPSTSSTEYTAPLTESISGVTIKAIAVKDGMINSAISSNAVTFSCATPVFTKNENSISISCPFPSSGVKIYYTTNGDEPTSSSTPYTSPIPVVIGDVIKAIAVATGYNNSEVATKTIHNELTPTDGKYLITSQTNFEVFVDMASTTAGATYHYILQTNVDAGSSITIPFSGTFDGGGYTISGLSHPLFNTVNGGVVKNVMLKNVQISSSGNVGAIAGVASGYTRIYNCGILPSDNKYENESSYVSSSDGNCGGLVGWLKDDSRVINCFSYANITGGTTVAGIVGYNDFASTAEESDGKYAKLKTAVVNCMFYGNITGGTTRYPVYGGEKILNNNENGINNYDFYRAEANLGLADNSHYNCSWPAQEEYLTKYEYYRYLLNSNRELCGWWIGAPSAPSGMSTTDVQAVPKDASLMAKWVLDPSIAPYPILKAPGKYYSAINQDPDNRINPVSKTWESRPTSENTIMTKAAPDTEGQKLGSITVNINKGGGLSGSDSKNIPITAMDIENNDFCYGKIQLPYYNSIFGDPSVEITGTTDAEKKSQWASRYGGNYGDQVVVGWEISAIEGGVAGITDNEDKGHKFTEDWQDGYNFADRYCTTKDENRTFAQGGYYYVPNGVTEITITAKWADATYLDNNDHYYDRISKSSIIDAGKGTHKSTLYPFKPAGIRSTTLGNGKTVKTGPISSNLQTGSVYEKAIVLVGNNQNFTGNANYGASSNGFTVMSVDFDLDNEPDYSLIWQLGNQTSRFNICPIRFDFLSVIEMGMAMKEDGSTQYYSLGCYRPLGHFEITETSLIHFGQFEFANQNRSLKAPLILNGGIYDQFTKGTGVGNAENDDINYVIIGGNVYIPSFTPGAHVNGNANYSTRHCAVNIIGGRINNFYLTGNFNNNVTPNTDNPHCYIDGGNFKQIAAAAKEGINGDVYFKINHSVINEFYGGSTLADKLVTGNINVTVDNSKITKYCGGPKFGNMASGKTVTTNATGTTFGVYYGGGNGGTSYVQYAKTDITEANAQNPYDWNGGSKGNLNSYTPTNYRSGDKNYMADYEMEIVNSSTGTDANKGIFRTYFYAAQFSATNTGPITNNLTDCKVLTSFYGGGNLGGVIGDVTSTLTDTEVLGSAFGAGYSASVPEVTIYNKDKTAPTLNVYTGIITPTPDPDPTSTSTTYTWCYKNKTTNVVIPVGVVIPAGVGTGNPTFEYGGKKYFYTEESLENLGTVTGKATLKIEGTTTVAKSVYGGGEESAVDGNTEVKVKGGTIGTENLGGAEYGNVYGGGKGSTQDVRHGLVKGNTKVTIENTGTGDNIVVPFIRHNVYGGGAYGSVGTYTYASDAADAVITGRTSGGKAEVIITGGTIGTTGEENGMVFGSSRGDVGAPGAIHDKLAWVYNTEVKIGTEGSGSVFTTPTIKGSVYGGGENGHVFNDAGVNIYSGTVGITTGAQIGGHSGAAYEYRGNVYGAGCGTDKYTDTNDENKEKYNPLAGTVQGNTTVNISGGHVVRNVYGAGAMGSVGTASVATSGKTTVTVSGGRIGYDGNSNNDGNIFGAARGDLAATGDLAQVRETEVNINYATTPTADNEDKNVQLIAGSVFGGGEAGKVKGSVAVNMTGGLVLKDVYGGGALADTQTSNWDASANNNAGGWATGKTSASSTTTVRLTGGTILGEAYGGALGQKNGVNGATSDIAAYVYGDVLLDLNGTTSSGETGAAIDNTEKGCVVGQVFGCNNINGSPKGDVMVHVYATQNKQTNAIAQKFILEKDSNTEKGGSESDAEYVARLQGILTGKIALAEALSITVSQENKDLCTAQNPTVAALTTAISGITTSINAKTTEEINAVRYDVEAVYGGGNMAAYVPVTPNTAEYNTSPNGSRTQVIIEGCTLTSIETVYGGGNAAAVPETNVTIHSAYEIGSVFGGGNGKDKILINNQLTDNPGADVGTLDQGASTFGTGNANSLLKGGHIHEAYGGSNTKGIVKGSLNQTSDPDTGEGACELVLDKIVGAGKYADIDGDVNMTLSCQPSSKVPLLFAGADEANVNGNITLNITNGNFGKVFGGNNLGGAVKGKITVNVEETGCQPIKIDELYLGGNEAAYSIYGYYESEDIQTETGKKILKPRESATDSRLPVKHDGTEYTSISEFTNYAQPELNIISCTYIGEVFGGGYGEGAVMYANPTVNVNMVKGEYGDNTTIGVPAMMNSLGLSGDAYANPNNVGIIRNVYGGGNAANVAGDTYVNIATKYLVKEVNVGDDVSSLYTRDTNESYTKASGTAQENVTYYEKSSAYIIGSVFGGGNAADVLGNTNVTMSDGYVFNGIFGGGYAGNVGTFTERSYTEKTYAGNIEFDHSTHNDCIGKPTKCKAGTGKCTVLVNGGQIGPYTVATLGMNRPKAQGGPVPEGWVWGAGQGLIEDPAKEPDTHFKSYVGSTDVTIGGTAFVLESIIGGGEFGRVLGDTKVTITGNCQIGVGAGKVDTNNKPIRYTDAQFVNPLTTTITGGENGNALAECSHFPYGEDTDNDGIKDRFLPYDPYYDEFKNTTYITQDHPDLSPASSASPTDGKTWIGCVFAGGSGYMPYLKKDDSGNPVGYDWCSSAGLVEGNTNLTISGGHILTNVYGGNEVTNVKGTCKITMTGGTIGVPRTVDQIIAHPLTCYLFGAGKGDQRPHFNTETNVGEVEINISGGIIYGSVFGGGEDGHVQRDVNLTIEKGADFTIGSTTYTNGPIIGTWGTSYVDGNVFGGGRGFGGDAYTAGNVAGSVDVKIKGGNILGSIYGGGRLGSVGYGLYPPTAGDEYYGAMRPDNTDDDAGNSPVSDFKRGYVDIEISGGTIGNRHEYIIPSADNTPSTLDFDGIATWSDDDWKTWGANNNIPLTEFDHASYRLKHTKGGNVFAGGMGRLYQLDGKTPISSVDWWKLGCVKSTKLTIKGGTIKSCVYGGGELGQVMGFHTTQNAANEEISAGTEIIIQNSSTTTPTIGTEIQSGSGSDAATQYTFGSVFGGGYGSLQEGTINNEYPKLIAGLVKKDTKIDMKAGEVKASIYGGGEMASVGESTTSGETTTATGSTYVAVSGGTIGIAPITVGTTTRYFGGATMGNVYGGGSGHGNTVRSGKIFKNTNVTISGSNTRIYHNIYGGGAYGTVGDFDYTTNSDNKVTGVKKLLAPGTGVATITITGGTIGYDGKNNGMVFGSSRGDVNKPGERDDYSAWVYDTHVTIGTEGEDDGPAIKGSVYGSGENGHTFNDTDVKVHSGTIGIHDGTDADGTRGNVYGAGCGTDKYYSTSTELFDGNGDAYNPLAGIVQGTATVTINGGHVLHNVYGAGAMGPVGVDGVGHKTTVNINGGRIGYDGNDNGNVYGGARGDQGIGRNFAYVGDTEVNINYADTPDGDNEGKTEKLIAGSVFGGGEAGSVHGGIVVNMNKGLVLNDVYGGGALADTNTDNWGTTTWAEGKTAASNITAVNLKGGTVTGNVYGGGLGKMAVGTEGQTGYEPAIEAKVYGNTTVELNNGVADAAKGCIVKGSIFGCNNMSGSPQGTTTVHIYKTQRDGASRITNTTEVTNAKVKGTKTGGEYVPSSFDVQAVYGGGNMAAFEPVDLTTGTTNVIIDGCESTSICHVYGGGNAASTPATNVTINGTYEIGELFGGGNGKDDIVKNNVTLPNPGANVGYKDYSEYYSEDEGVTWKVKDAENATTKEDRLASSYVYGTGVATVNVFGGLVHRVFGGSNTKGNVRQTALTLLDENNECPFCVDEAYGGGKSAEMDAEAKLLMACIPGLQAAYGGAEEADVHGNVTLNITNGSFDRVFGGNNLSGTISGSITVNIEEIGCRPIKIGELYGGGNQAGYSVYGYNADGTPKESGTKLYDDPQVNVKSFTSIGKVFGGGYGSGATMVGNPTVSVNEVYGRYYNQDVSVVGEDAKTSGNYPIPSHEKGKMGAISEVFGGGNAAKVIGNTMVNIATLSDVYIVKEVTAGATLPADCYTRSGEGTTASPFVYTPASGTASVTVTYYEKKTVLGADIRGNVYGGGNNAEVTGNTNVFIGRDATTTTNSGSSTTNP